MEPGCAIIVGVVEADGQPSATRGWGLEPLSDSQAIVVVSDDITAEPGTPIAVTAAHVRTYETVQFKGRVIGDVELTPDLRYRVKRHCDTMFVAINETDGTPMELMEAWKADRLRALAVGVSEVFDQTPGPNAGAALRFK